MASILGSTPLDTRIALESDLPTKPYDAEIAYLESTGTQYINTGIVPTPTLSLDCSGYFPNGSPGMRFGSRASANSECFYAVGVISNSANLVRYSFGASGTWDELQRYTAAKPHRRFILNASTKSVFIEYSDGASEVLSFSQSAFTGSFPLFLFAFNNAGTASSSASGTRLSACRIFDGSTLVRDFQPVRVGSGSSAVGYLYDRVSGTLFGNAGDNNAGFAAECCGADLPHGIARVAKTGDVSDLSGWPDIITLSGITFTNGSGYSLTSATLRVSPLARVATFTGNIKTSSERAASSGTTIGTFTLPYKPVSDYSCAALTRNAFMLLKSSGELSMIPVWKITANSTISFSFTYLF